MLSCEDRPTDFGLPTDEAELYPELKNFRYTCTMQTKDESYSFFETLNEADPVVTHFPVNVLSSLCASRLIIEPEILAVT